MTVRADARAGENPFREMPTVGVVMRNSIGFVEQMLENLRQGIVSVPVAHSSDKDRLDATFTTDVIEPGSESGWIGNAFHSDGGDMPAQIAFTSGTQGKPKAVLLSRTNLHDVVTRVTELMEITDEIREYVGIPVYHSFGYARCRIVLNAGGRAFIPKSFDLAEIRSLLKAGEINAIAAVPSLWRIFLAGLDRFGDELERVRWVEIGSQYMSGSEKAALRAALPNAKIVQHYGLTEASRTSLQRIDKEALGRLDSVGMAVGRTELRINERGHIETRGPHVALGILSEGTWQPLGPDAWLETSDLGRIDNGLLYFVGRGDDVINCGGVKISPDLLESAVRQALAENGEEAGEFALLRLPDPMRGDGIGLVITPATRLPRERLLDTLVNQVGKQGVNARGAITVHELSDLPRTETGKVQRKALAALIEENKPSKITNAGATRGGFAELLEELLGRPIDPHQSFADLGGDSLAHMQVTLALERALENAPTGWEWRPLERLISEVAQAGDFKELMTRTSGAPPLPDGSRNMNPTDISLWSLIAEDYRTNGGSVFHQGFLMLLVHRFGNARMSVQWKLLRAPLTILYRILNKFTQLFFGMKLDYTVKVGRRVRLEHFGGMILGAREIGNDVVLRQNTTLGIRSTDDLNAKPILGDFVDVGAGAVIVGNVTIGEHSVVGANSVVFTNVPPGSMVMGVPARIIGKVRGPENTA